MASTCVLLVIFLQTLSRTCPHILETIFSYLPGYTCAHLLSRLKIPEREKENWQKKYVRLLRDLPEHAPWIEKMIANHHGVFLMGVDIRRLMDRLENPDTYWKKLGRFANEEPLRLWLAVRVSRNAHEARQQRLRNEGFAYTSVLNDGSVYLGPNPRKVGKDEILTESNVILPSEIAKESEDCHGASHWVRSIKPNGSNIHIAFAQGPRFGIMEEDITPRVKFCPVQVDKRANGDVMGKQHLSAGGGNRCSEITPGAEVALVDKRGDNIWFQLPYICLNTGKQLTSVRVPEVLDGEEFRPNEYAFITDFHCMDQANGCNIRSRLHGVPWPCN